MNIEQRPMKKLKTTENELFREFMAANESFIALEGKVRALSKVESLHWKLKEVNDGFVSTYKKEWKSSKRRLGVF